ncbi:MAG: hypothetical protein HYV40_06685 [Candidatus Levybacteria bacterium]|nr:hypothetical protein [Candidatus Levybacteria bacterium]
MTEIPLNGVVEKIIQVVPLLAEFRERQTLIRDQRERRREEALCRYQIMDERLDQATHRVANTPDTGIEYTNARLWLTVTEYVYADAQREYEAFDEPSGVRDLVEGVWNLLTYRF